MGLQELIIWGADVNAVNKRGYTPLLYAIENRNCALVKFFLSMNVNVDRKNNKQTELILAAKQKSPEIIDLLIQHGCDSKAKDTSGKTALYHGVHSQCSRTMQNLIRGGVSPLEVENYFFNSSIDNAKSHYLALDKEVNAVWGRRDVVKFVYYYQSDLSEFAKILDDPNFYINECILDNGWTLLHLAVYFDRVELVKLLLEKNAAITKSSRLVKKESFLSKFCSLISWWPWMANHTQKSTGDDGQCDLTPLHIACAIAQRIRRYGRNFVVWLIHACETFFFFLSKLVPHCAFDLPSSYMRGFLFLSVKIAFSYALCLWAFSFGSFSFRQSKSI